MNTVQVIINYFLNWAHKHTRTKVHVQKPKEKLQIETKLDNLDITMKQNHGKHMET